MVYGLIFLKSIDPDCFGKEYLIKNAEKVKGIEYYDSSQKLYGFGDIEIDLPIYQFANNQYVKIKQDGRGVENRPVKWTNEVLLVPFSVRTQKNRDVLAVFCGERGIRTPGTVTGTTV